MKQGVNPKIVQERLGHSSIGITMDIYSHVMPNMQRDAMANFNIALAPIK
jgi:integrase